MEEHQRFQFIRSAKPRPQEGNWKYHDGVRFMIDPKNPATEITLREGTFILVRCNRVLTVMQVTAILEKPKGGARLRTRTGVLPGGLAAPSMLSCPRAEYPRQVFWQVDGGQYFSSDRACPADPERGTLHWNRVLAVCSVKHRSSLTDDDMQAYKEPLPGASELLSNGERFFYSKSLEHNQCFRIEDFCLPCDEQYKSGPIQKEGPLVMMDVCCGVGGVTMGANMLNEAVRKGATQEAGAHIRQINVEYAIEEDSRVRNAYVENAHQGNPGSDQKICKSITVKECLSGIKQQAKNGMEPVYGKAPRKKELDILHMSPPCQAMSKVNMHANMATIKKEMFPVLDQCKELVRELDPKFVTVEEVPAFLINTVKKENKNGSQGQEVRCIWRLLLPLLDMGYQVDMRILNAVHFAVPQIRVRLILWAAKAGYVLPTPPSPWTHYEVKSPGVQKDDALRMCMNWNDLAVISDAVRTNEPLPPAVSARDAIHDLPLHAEAGSPSHVSSYSMDVEGSSALAKFLRCEQGLLLYHWMPGAASNTEKCLTNASERSCYDKPFPTICGSTSHHAANNLCPRPGANRLITVAERKRLQGIPDHARLDGPVTAQIQQVGNAVPPLLAWAILGSVFSAAYGVEAPKPQFVLDMQRAATEAATRAAEDAHNKVQSTLEQVKKLAALGDCRELGLDTEARRRLREIRSLLQARTSPQEKEDPPAASRAHPQKWNQLRPAVPAGRTRWKPPRVGVRRNPRRAAQPEEHPGHEEESVVPCPATSAQKQPQMGGRRNASRAAGLEEHAKHEEEAIVLSALPAGSLGDAPFSGVSAAHDMAAAVEASPDALVAGDMVVANLPRGAAAELPEASVQAAAAGCMIEGGDMAAAADEAADLDEAQDDLFMDAHEEFAAASPDQAVPVSSALEMLQIEAAAAAVPAEDSASEADMSAGAAAGVPATGGDLGQDTAGVEVAASSGEGSSTPAREIRGQKRKAIDILDEDPDEEAEEFDPRADVVRGMAVLLRTNDDSHIGWDKVWSIARVYRHDKKKGKLNVTWLKPASLEDPWAQRWRDWTVEKKNKKGGMDKGIWSSQGVDIDTVQWGTRLQPNGLFQAEDQEVLRSEIERMEAVMDVLPT